MRSAPASPVQKRIFSHVQPPSASSVQDALPKLPVVSRQVRFFDLSLPLERESSYAAYFATLPCCQMLMKCEDGGCAQESCLYFIVVVVSVQHLRW
mmetsp:Transcript_10784/g.15345  ORF Transcript_10784/g.15345 Transcript_10784/m.15345 type:complete len:96 (+) Transcript_10784:959-1246(+)